MGVCLLGFWDRFLSIHSPLIYERTYPLVTDALVAGSKKTLGSYKIDKRNEIFSLDEMLTFAGSWACTKPFNSAFLGAFVQKTLFRLVGGFLVKSYHVFSVT